MVEAKFKLIRNYLKGWEFTQSIIKRFFEDNINHLIFLDVFILIIVVYLERSYSVIEAAFDVRTSANNRFSLDDWPMLVLAIQVRLTKYIILAVWIGFRGRTCQVGGCWTLIRTITCCNFIEFFNELFPTISYIYYFEICNWCLRARINASWVHLTFNFCSLFRT